jgi:ribosomal protein L40E
MPIETEKNRCIACGAPLNIPVPGGRIKCEFCGAEAIYTPDARKKETELVCPKCGAMLPKEAEHCSRCGLKLEFDCPKCGARNSYGADFCVKCGINIPQELDLIHQAQLRQEEMQRRMAAAARAQVEAQKAAQRRKNRIAGIVFLVLLCLAAVITLVVMLGVYNANYSPSAKATQAAHAEPILTNTDPRTLMPAGSYSIWERTLSTDQETTNAEAAYAFPPGNMFGRITGYRQVYADSDYCNPTWDVIYQGVQVVIYQDSDGALEALDYLGRTATSTEYKFGDKAYIDFTNGNTSAYCDTPFDIRWVDLSFTRYNVVGIVYIETLREGGSEDSYLEFMVKDIAQEILDKIDARVGR